MRNEIIGTYWLCKNRCGTIWLVQGNEPTKVGGAFSHNLNSPSEMGWLMLYDEDGCKFDDYAFKEGIKIESSDFHELKFPEIPNNSCIEIEIGKSGRVYQIVGI